MSEFRLIVSVLAFTLYVPLAICWTIDLHTATDFKNNSKPIFMAFFHWFLVAVALVGIVHAH